MFLWHPETQAHFLKAAMSTTDTQGLALMPRLEFADSLTSIKKVLDAYPKDQTEEVNARWDWEVIQSVGAYSDLKQEVVRRFKEFPPQALCDAVTNDELEVLISGLSRGDMPGDAIKEICRFRGQKIGCVKLATVRQLKHLSPKNARVLIKEQMLPRKAGVGMQTAGLRMLVELKIPEPLDLYRAAWSKGKCPRDVAGIILAKVNSMEQGFQPEQVRGFFNFFKDMSDEQEECIYVAGLLLDQLVEGEQWSLPFLPEVVSELALLPGTTTKAVDALLGTTSHVTEVVKALTTVIRAARLAYRAEKDADPVGPDAQVITDLSSYMAFDKLRHIALKVGRMDLMLCQPEVLVTFSDELMRRWQDQVGARESDRSGLLECVLTVWVKLLRSGGSEVWPGILAKMEARLSRWGTPNDLGALAKVIAESIPSMELGAKEHEAMVTLACDFFKRLIDEYLMPEESGEEKDSQRKKDEQAQRIVMEKILLDTWTGLLSHGCTEQESSRLFSQCPEKHRVQMASNIVSRAIKDTKEVGAIQYQKKRPDAGWAHAGGMRVQDVKIGSVVDGTVTNSSGLFGVFFNFGCERDGRLNVPTHEWKNYRVGDKVTGMIVNKVDHCSKNSFIQLILPRDKGCTSHGLFPAWETACRAVQWLSSPVEARKEHFSTVASLWASVVSADVGDVDFDANLALLNTPLPPARDCVLLIEKLMSNSPGKDLVRKALLWLAQKSPEDAVRLWPTLLQPSSKQTAEGAEEVFQDAEALLKLCEGNGLEPPKIPMLTARSFSKKVLDRFASSPLPEVRIMVVQALWEKHHDAKKEKLPPVLDTLKEDKCEVVAVAARNLITKLTETKK